MKRYLFACASIFAIAVIWNATGRGEQPPGLPHFMQAKLEYSQKILEGLAMEDFDKLEKHANQLSLLSLAAQWQVMQTPEYAQQSREFRRTVDALSDAAKKKNLDGATLAFVDVTMKCVNCHKYVRGTRMAALEPHEPGLPGLSLERLVDAPATLKH